MARIALNVAQLVSRQFISEIQQVISLRDQLTRTKNIMDEITTGGTVLTALETSTEIIGSGANAVPLAAGQGAIMYNAVVTLLAGTNSASVLAIIKQFDQG
jgi:hypothetical protein